MSLGFLAPIALAGLALGVVPWILHRLRRPDRNTAPFGSLMFVPPSQEVARPARRIEHPLLMALRILVLLLLAAAFARPFLPSEAMATVDTRDTLHVIALDVSASMQRAGAFEAARDQIDTILARVGANHRVGLMTFGAQAPWAVPLDPANASSVADVRSALAGIAPGHSADAPISALRKAEGALIAAAGDDPARPLVLHLVSDLQRGDVEAVDSDWRLTQRVEFRIWPCRSNVDANTAVVDATVERSTDGLRVRARIRQTPPGPHPVIVTLTPQDGAPRERAATLAADGSANVSFTIDHPDDRPARGVLTLASDGVSYDDTLYWAWNPTRPRPATIVRDDRKQLRFVELALEAPSDAGFALTDATPDDFAAETLAPGTVVIAAGASWSAPTWAALNEHVARGGGGLILIDRLPAAAGAAALADWGVRVGAPTPDQRAQTLSWIDFAAPGFAAFRGARWNDFSALRFEQWLPVELGAAGDDAPVVEARFDPVGATDDGAPAVLRIEHGAGAARLWCFGVDPVYTNLTKSPRFVPLLHETVVALGGPALEPTAYKPGEAIAAIAQRDEVLLPGADRFVALDEAARGVDVPGHAIWRGDDGVPWIETVNVDRSESRLEYEQPEALMAAIAGPRSDTPGVGVSGGKDVAHARPAEAERREIGWPFLVAAAGVLLAEFLLAWRLGG